MSISAKPSGYNVDSKYQLYNIQNFNGINSIPSCDGKFTITGNSGDGYAKITFIEPTNLVSDLKIKLITPIGTIENDTLTYNKGTELGNIPSPIVEDSNLVFKGRLVCRFQI